MLDKWILELKPEEKKYCRSGGHNVKYTREQKEEAVISLCARNKPAKEVAAEYGTTRENPYNLIVPYTKQRKYNSYKGEISPEVENIINLDFHADKPNTRWLTDLTEFHIPAGKVYLSPIIDCFDGLPVSWCIDTSPSAELVNTMLDKAILSLNGNEKPIYISIVAVITVGRVGLNA